MQVSELYRTGRTIRKMDRQSSDEQYSRYGMVWTAKQKFLNSPSTQNIFPDSGVLRRWRNSSAWIWMTLSWILILTWKTRCSQLLKRCCEIIIAELWDCGLILWWNVSNFRVSTFTNANILSWCFELYHTCSCVPNWKCFKIF